MLRTSHGLLCALKSLRSMLEAPGGKSFTFTFSTITEVIFCQTHGFDTTSLKTWRRGEAAKT
jgi:hypothetical protein